MRPVLATYRYGFSIDLRRLLVCGAGGNCFCRAMRHDTPKPIIPQNNATAELTDLADQRARSVPRVSEFVLTRNPEVGSAVNNRSVRPNGHVFSNVPSLCRAASKTGRACLDQTRGFGSELCLVAINRTKMKSSEVHVERATRIRNQADWLPSQDFRDEDLLALPSNRPIYAACRTTCRSSSVL